MNNWVSLKFKNPILSLIYLAVFFFVGCYNPTDDNEVEFKIDRTLLADSSFFYKGLQLFPPKNWIKSDLGILPSGNIPESLASSIIATFQSDTSQCFMIITLLPEMPVSLPDSMLANPGKFFNKDSTWMAIQPSQFNYHSFICRQFVLQNSDIVVFKLLLTRDSKNFELDYIVPRNYIPILAKSVESSIGSIQYIEPNKNP